LLDHLQFSISNLSLIILISSFVSNIAISSASFVACSPFSSDGAVIARSSASSNASIGVTWLSLVVSVRAEAPTFGLGYLAAKCCHIY
jgi:hypothetical protein